MMKLSRSAIALAAMTGLVGAALAQAPPKPPTALETAKTTAENRHHLFHVIGYEAGPALNLLKSAPYNAAAVKLAGVRLEINAGMIKEMTKEDTSKLVPKSMAKTNIWTERADFEAKADALVAAGIALKNSTDEASAKKAAQQTAGVCKSCHDKFRNEEGHH